MENEKFLAPGDVGAPTTRSIYEQVGGKATITRLATAFYARVEQDKVLRPLYPRSLHCAQAMLGRYLVQFFGGPNEYEQQRFTSSLSEAHAHLQIGRAEREAWLRAMNGALDESGIGEPAASAMRRYFAEAATFFMNDTGAQREASAPDAVNDTASSARMAEYGTIDAALGQRWHEERAIEALYAAVRAGDAAQSIALAENPTVRLVMERNREAYLNLLTAMGCRGVQELLDYVDTCLQNEPALLANSAARRQVLLHAAAGMWALPFVAVLLKRGADPNRLDQFGHPPLYAAANRPGPPPGCDENTGVQVVEYLIMHGADVNIAGGVKQCTALHMAARNGQMAIAEALLAHGADLEARDALGETPLRRAVNCGKAAIVAVLIAHGANIETRGSDGLTPLQAAHSTRLKLLFQNQLPANFSD